MTTEELLSEFKTGVGEIQTELKTLAPLREQAKTLADETLKLRADLDELRRRNHYSVTARRPGRVSVGCARKLGALALVARVRSGRETPDKPIAAIRAAATAILGEAEVRAALTTSEVPLPQEYSGEVVELIEEFGSARRLGTVYPMGAGTVILPKLVTSPTFGLIAMSATVTEKSPDLDPVTMTAQKWGGLIRLPAELDEDSIVALGQFLARYTARELARIEDTVFWIADGSGTYASLSGLLKVLDVAATREVLDSGETANNAMDLDDVRAVRARVASPVLGRGRYFFHPTFESLFSSFNTAGDKPYVSNGIQGSALDGFPIEWVDVLPPLSATAAANQLFGAFGDPSYSYLGVRGGPRLDTSIDAGFTTDEILVRAVERFSVAHLASNHCAIMKTAAA